jgi:hypothetical protein
MDVEHRLTIFHVYLRMLLQFFPTPFSFFHLLLHVGVDRYALSIHGE